jgi:hypothetical protein
VLVAIGAPALFWLRPNDQAGAKTEEGRRAQVVQGLTAAQTIVATPTLCSSPTALADAWRNLKMARRDDPEWEHAGQMTEKLETCRTGLAKALSDSVGELRHRQRTDLGENVRRHLQTQGFDTKVTLLGPDKSEALVMSPQLTPALLDRVTAGMSVQNGTFLENWQKVGVTKVTFSDGKRRWSYDLPKLPEAYQDVSVLDGLGLGQTLALQDRAQ